MSPRLLVHTACKVFGLYLLVLAAMNLRDIIYWILLATTESAFGGHSPLMSMLPVYMMLTNTAFGLLLIFQADLVVEKIVPSDTDKLSLTVASTDLIELAIIIVSIASLLSALPEILIKLLGYAYLNPYERDEKANYWNNESISGVLYSVLKFVTGLFLLLNARYLGRMLARIGQKEDARHQISLPPENKP